MTDPATKIDPATSVDPGQQVDPGRLVVLGVDTHKDFHHGALITTLGAEIADRRFPATGAGYDALIGWAAAQGTILQAGVEGTGSYGAGLTTRLREEGIRVIEVMSPDKQERRLRGKTDQLDAYAAARAVLARRSRTVPKIRHGEVEALRVLRTTRKLLIGQRTQIINQLQGLLVTAPEPLRAKLAGRTGKTLATACSRLRRHSSDDFVTTTIKDTLKLLARRYLDLHAQTRELERAIRKIVKTYAPELLDIHGIGPDVAATLLVTTGENPDRLTSEAALAHLAGAAPIPASSGKTRRYRLNRGGNRQGNSALHRIVLVRMKTDPRTIDYVARTLARGKSKRDAMRLLKRYVAREVFPILLTIQHNHTTSQPGTDEPAPIAA